MSLPSTLPRKFNVLARKSSPARLIVSLPLMTSSPMLSSPMVGPLLAFERGRPARGPFRRIAAGAAARNRRSRRGRAPWCSRAGSASRGDRRALDAGERLQYVAGNGHQRAGVAGGNAGLRPPSFTRFSATRIEESFFLRSATSTGSSISTTSVAGRPSARAHPALSISSIARGSGLRGRRASAARQDANARS